MSSTTAFKKGQKVTYQTNRGREGSGTVVDITDYGKGAWYSIKNADGSISKARAGLMKAA